MQSAFPMELVNRIIDDASYWPHSSVTLEWRLKGFCLYDTMFMRTLPIGVPGTEGDFSFVGDDFNQNGAAWTKKLTLGKADNPSCSTTLLHPCRKVEFQFWCRDQFQADAAHPEPWFDASIQNLQPSIFADKIVEWPASLILKNLNRSGGEVFRAPTDPQPFIRRPHAQQKYDDLGNREETIVWHYLDSCDKDPTEAKEAARPETLDGKSMRSMRVGDCIVVRGRVLFSGVAKIKTTVYWAV